MSEALRKKLDARAQFQLLRVGLKGELEVMLLTAAPPTLEQQVELRNAGCNTQDIIGNVLSGTIDDASHLEDLADLPFVRKIEVSRTMFSE